MAYKKETVKKVKQQFSEKRNVAIGIAKERLERLHREYPDLAAIDAALAETGVRIVEEVMKGGEEIVERIAAVRRDNEKLQEDRAAMLVYYGFPADYTEVHYACDRCDDTGYVGVDMCLCMRKALAAESLADAGLAPLARSQRFDTFDLKYYRGEHLVLMEKNLDYCMHYAESFHEHADSLLFIGNTGLGKTHLSTAIAVSVAEKGFDIHYSSAPNLFASLEAEKFGRAAETTLAELLDAEFLIIDDLGTENPSALNVNFLYTVVNTRLVNRKPTLINTNLMPGELKTRYTDRLASRLLGEYIVKRFMGNDVRMQKIGF